MAARGNPESMSSESPHLSIARVMGNIARSIGWDGVLPLVVASVPLVVKIVLPDAGVGTGFTVAVLLVFAALIRAHLGASQIAGACGGEVPFLRQISLAAAIVVLLLFEAAVGIMTFSKDVPASGWWFPVAFYAVYVVLISLSLWPAQLGTDDG